MKDNVNDFRAVEALFHRVSSLGQTGYLIFLLTFHFSLTFSLKNDLIIFICLNALMSQLSGVTDSSCELAAALLPLLVLLRILKGFLDYYQIAVALIRNPSKP